jgi:hypothetical protein
MDKHFSHSRGEVLIIAFMGLAVALLCALGMSWYLNRDNRWVRIVSPPNKPLTEILAVDRVLRAYVKTRQGELYLCGGTTWRDSCRAVASEELPKVKVPVQWTGCTSAFPQLPAPPGAVIDSLEVGRCLEASTYSKLIILDDGSLWQWYRVFSWANPFAFVTTVILGLGIGLAGGKVIVKLRRYMAPLEESPARSDTAISAPRGRKPPAGTVRH